MKATEFKCQVKSNRMLTPTVFELTFDTEQPLEFKAGQFVSVIVPGAGPKGRDLRRAYSIASSPELRPIELCVKLVEDGPGTNYLYGLHGGAEFRGVAPYGDFVYRTHSAKNACFIATGTGIAPFRSMVFSTQYKEAPPAKAFCWLGVRTAPELLYTEEFQNIAESRVRSDALEAGSTVEWFHRPRDGLHEEVTRELPLARDGILPLWQRRDDYRSEGDPR